MKLDRWFGRMAGYAALALVATATTAAAQWGRERARQEDELFEWTGRVDREVQIVMRGNQVWTRNLDDRDWNRPRTRVYGTLPRRDGSVDAVLVDGRGRVDVIQQPTYDNGYTTIVRVIDRAGGSDQYKVAAYWERYTDDVYSGGTMNRGRRDADDDDGGYRRRETVPSNGPYGNRQTMLHWSGNVDDELELRIQNGRVDYRTVSGAQPTSIRVDRGVMDSRRSGAVGVLQNQGRGTVFVVQQPSAWNAYTAVIRIRDPQGGYGFYDFDLYWQ